MTRSTIPVDRLPCSSCPYRVDTPAGVWHPDEYLKLPTYDDPLRSIDAGVFLCHHSPLTSRETLCRGWLSVHADSLAVRLGVAVGLIDGEAVYAPVDVELYVDGATACAAGLKGVEQPSVPARRMIDKLTRRRARAAT